LSGDPLTHIFSILPTIGEPKGLKLLANSCVEGSFSLGEESIGLAVVTAQPKVLRHFNRFVGLWHFEAALIWRHACAGRKKEENMMLSSSSDRQERV
jgi:hypothetical protein